MFEGQTPFNVLGSGYQRPFELATLRLSNMIGILPKCALPKPCTQMEPCMIGPYGASGKHSHAM